jgi:hypothetical protein
MIIALGLSFLIAGLGIVYEGDLTLGVGLILLWLILSLIALYSVGFVSAVVGAAAIIVWSYSLFTTFFMSATN